MFHADGRCAGCGQILTTGGCINASCPFGTGGTYLNGVKIATAGGVSLFQDSRAAQLRARIAAMSDAECAELWEKLQRLP